jgi:hypothetical protein
VFFHGLQPGHYSDAHWRAWQSEDGSCIWPNTWLVGSDAVPGAHVLSISYNRGLAKALQGTSDMYIITENLLSDVLEANIGQKKHCPVILVGHCIGGLIIKDLCVRAHARLYQKPSQFKAKAETFLNNIGGIFYYDTPHQGMSIPKRLEKELPQLLLPYFLNLSKEAARLNHEFNNLDKSSKLLLAGVGADRSTDLVYINSHLGHFKLYCFKRVVCRN